MDVPKVGDFIRFRPYLGREVEGVIRAIWKTNVGIKFRVEYGTNVATINLDQILTPGGPKDKPSKDIEF